MGKIVVRTGEDLRVSRGVNQIDAINTEKILLTLPQASVPGDDLLVNACAADVDVEGGALDILGQDQAGVVTVPSGSSALFTLTSCCDPNNASKKREWAVLRGTNKCGDEISVPNLAALAALDVSGCLSGLRVFVQTLSQFFELDRASTATPDNIATGTSVTTVAAIGGGNWLRVIEHAPHWTNQRTWKVDPVSGNDENNGLTAATALKTLAEWCRRVVYFNLLPTEVYYDIECLNNIPDTDSFKPTGLMAPTDSDYSIFPLKVRGQRLVQASGTTAAAAAADPATNTPPTFDGGVGFNAAAHVGRMIVAASGAVAWILNATGAQTAMVSDWTIANLSGISPGLTLLTAAEVTALIGQSYTVVDFTQFAPVFTSVGAPLARLRFDNLHFTPDAAGILEPALAIKGIAASLGTCRVRRRIGAVAGGQISLFACVHDLPAYTRMSTSQAAVLAYANSGVRNIEFILVEDDTVIFTDVVMDSSSIQSATPETQTHWQGRITQNGFSGGKFTVCGGRTGIFNSPKDAVRLMNGGIGKISQPLYGSGNAGFGVVVGEAAKLLVINALTAGGAAYVPTITGANGDVRLEPNRPSPAQPAPPAAGMNMPRLEDAAGAVLPALSALGTWANWNAAPFNRYAVSYTSGAVISNTDRAV